MKHSQHFPPPRLLRRLGIAVTLLLWMTNASALIPLSASDTNDGIRKLAPNVHPVNTNVRYNSFYDVNGDGVMEVVGGSELRDASNNWKTTYLHMVSSPNGNPLAELN